MTDPDEAVEAAARVIYEQVWPIHRKWDALDSTIKTEFLERGRAALTAAAPYIRARELEDTVRLAGDVLRGSGWADPAQVDALRAEVRAQVAAEIRGSIDDTVFHAPGWRAGINDAVAVVEAGMP